MGDRKLNVGDFSARKIDSTRSLCREHIGEKQITTSGKCVICLEEFVKDDVIVWSENETCNHVYHKDCMVNYLASNAECQETTMKLDDNPCPACRQNYCHVRDEDIAQLMQKKISAKATRSPDPPGWLPPP